MFSLYFLIFLLSSVLEVGFISDKQNAIRSSFAFHSFVQTFLLSRNMRGI